MLADIFQDYLFQGLTGSCCVPVLFCHRNALNKRNRGRHEHSTSRARTGRCGRSLPPTPSSLFTIAIETELGGERQRLVTSMGNDALGSVPSQCPGHSICLLRTLESHTPPQTQMGLGGMLRASRLPWDERTRSILSQCRSEARRCFKQSHRIHLVESSPSRLPINSRETGSLPWLTIHHRLGQVVSKSRVNTQGSKNSMKTRTPGRPGRTGLGLLSDGLRK